MKINSGRLEELLAEMKKYLEDGSCTYVTMCIHEQDEIQIQVKVTSDRQEFVAAVTTGVVESGNS